MPFVIFTTTKNSERAAEKIMFLYFYIVMLFWPDRQSDRQNVYRKDSHRWRESAEKKSELYLSIQNMFFIVERYPGVPPISTLKLLLPTFSESQLLQMTEDILLER